jgi:hypothetical protein
MARTLLKELIIERAQRDSAKKTSKFGLNMNRIDTKLKSMSGYYICISTSYERYSCEWSGMELHLHM